MSETTNLRFLVEHEMESYRAHLLRLDEAAMERRFNQPMDAAALDAHCLQLTGSGVSILALQVEGQTRAAAEISPPSDDIDVPRELAFSVERDFQGFGLGTLLATRAIAEIRPHAAVMYCGADNGQMLSLAGRLGAEVTVKGGVAMCMVDTERRACPREGFREADGLSPAIAAFALGR
ncbi:hypothetical protein ACKTEK_07000 [Tepidamorphus sp. 3E244]|uniref:hypothetical protein n=1 Tax=Tepidamorphus sp. 3E244 TaxID=3385498 RepID=UPI0038FC1159